MDDSGTPEAPEAETTLTLEATNEEAEAGSTAPFKLTVAEALPTIEKPADQTSTAGTAISSVVVKGTRLEVLEAKELPAGLTLTKRSLKEWAITGTPTTAKGAATVALEAKNKEEQPPPRDLPMDRQGTRSQERRRNPAKPTKRPRHSPPPPRSSAPGASARSRSQKQGHVAVRLVPLRSGRMQGPGDRDDHRRQEEFKIHSARTPIAQGKKVRIALKLSKTAAGVASPPTLKKHKKVTAALGAHDRQLGGLPGHEGARLTVGSDRADSNALARRLGAFR